MSTTQQASLRSSMSCSNSPDPPDYIPSGQETSMQRTPILTNEEVYYNQYQAKQQQDQSHGNVFTLTNISPPFASFQGNTPSVFYSQQTSQAAYESVYQWAVPQTALTTTQTYNVQPQAALDLKYSGHQILAPVEGTHTQVYVNSWGYQNKILQNQLVEHQPCIQKLMELEANLAVLSKETNQQQIVIRRLENSCKKKDNNIVILKQNSNLKACGINTKNNDSKEKDTSIEVLKPEKIEEPENEESKTSVHNAQQTEENRSNDGFLCRISSESMKQELLRLRLENRDVIRLQAKLCKLKLGHDELKHIKDENSSQRHEITHLERRLLTFEEDSGVSIISRDLTSFGESSSDYTATVDLEAKALSN